MNKERLLRLADYLDNLEPNKWDFRNVTNAETLEELLQMCSIKGHCGTTACALGHLPCVWPDTFRWYLGENGPKFFPVYVKHQNAEEVFITDVYDFLDITEDEFDYLFQPDNCWNKNYLALPDYATQYDVAARIKDVVQYGFPVELYEESDDD